MLLINATQRLDRVLYCPGSYHWSREETLILLAGYANGCLEDVVRLLPHRSYKSFQHRIAQVRKELEKANVMREPSWPIESPKVSTHVQCESFSIRDVEELVLQNQIAEQRRRACAAKLMRMSKNYQRRLRALRAKTALTTRRLLEAQRYIQQITVHDDEEYQIRLSKEDLKIISCIKDNPVLYKTLLADPSRNVQLISNNIKKLINDITKKIIVFI